jgi:hypothetical protein
MNGYIIHGGSLTRRHKISIAECRLAKFLYLTDLSDNKTDHYFNYKENLISSNKYDEVLYKFLKTGTDIEEFKNFNPVFFEYLKINREISINAQLLEIDQQILKLKDSIKTLESEISSCKDIVSNDSESYQSDKTYLDKMIQLHEKKLDLSIRDKHRMNINNKIKNFKESIVNLNNKIESNKKRLVVKEQKRIKLLNELDLKNSSREQLISDKQDLNNNASMADVKKLSKTSKNITSNLSKTRKFHSMSVLSRSESSNKNLSFDINSPIFLELNRIILNSPIDNKSQIKIERFLLNQGTILLSNRLNELLDINYYKLNSHVLNYIKNCLGDLNKLINNLKRNISKKKETDLTKGMLIILLNIDNKTIISYLLGRVLIIISNNNLVNSKTISTNIAIDLSKDLVNLYISNEYNDYLIRNKVQGSDLESYLFESESSNDYTLSDFKLDNKDKFSIFDNDEFLLDFGLYLLNTLEDVGIINTKVIQLNRDEKQTIFIVVKEISDHITDSLNFQALPYKIPMIVKPKDYSLSESGKEILGGYLLNDKEFVSPLIIKNSELKDQSVIDKNNYIYKMINNMSSVGFKINEDVLDFILTNGVKYNLVIDPDYVHDLELKKKEGKTLSLYETKDLDSFISKRNLERNIIGLALIYRNILEFFIPVRIDNRGRVYCTSDYLNYQSIELAKSLLSFSKGEKIYKNDKFALNFLKIYGANCFGNGIDKKSYEDRIK